MDASALQTMGLPGDVCTIEVEPRPGGKFLFTDKRPMGVVFHWGTYKVIDRPHRLTFTWNAGDKVGTADDELSLVTITFAATEVGCNVRSFILWTLNGEITLNVPKTVGITCSSAFATSWKRRSFSASSSQIQGSWLCLLGIRRTACLTSGFPGCIELVIQSHFWLQSWFCD